VIGALPVRAWIERAKAEGTLRSDFVPKEHVMTLSTFAAAGTPGPVATSADYRPGICNIGPAEIARRRRDRPGTGRSTRESPRPTGRDVSMKGTA